MIENLIKDKQYTYRIQASIFVVYFLLLNLITSCGDLSHDAGNALGNESSKIKPKTKDKPVVGISEWLLAMHFDNEKFDVLFSGEKPALKEIYPYPRHITLVWLRQIDKTDMKFITLKRKLEKIVADFIKEANQKSNGNYSVTMSDVGAWPDGGIFLKPSMETDAKLRELDNRLRTEISRMNFEHYNHLKEFHPHITILSKKQANSILSIDKQREFMGRLRSRIHSLGALPTDWVFGWFD